MGKLREVRCAALKAQQELDRKRQQADELMRRARLAKRRPIEQIEAGAANDRSTELSLAVAQLCAPLKKSHVQQLLRLARRVASLRLDWLVDLAMLRRLCTVAQKMELAIGDLDAWVPTSHNRERQFASLTRHLFARYPVPAFFDSAWTEHADPKWAGWFIHVGQGTALRAIVDCDLDMTKRMQHHTMLAPADLDVGQAIRFGQVMALGGTVPLARAIVGTRIGRPGQNEAFWSTVVQFFCSAGMFDLAQVGPIVDYLNEMRFMFGQPRIVNGQVIPSEIAEPNLSMKGRTMGALLRQVEQWHDRLARVRRHGQLVTWARCGITELQRVEGVERQKLWRVVELLTSSELTEEGRALKHCVSSYAGSCASGRTAIFSLRLLEDQVEQRLITLEVHRESRMLVQARGRYNRLTNALEARIIRSWLMQANLQVAGHVGLGMGK
jgi:hypothetical protein